jgi:hypothetical protein
VYADIEGFKLTSASKTALIQRLIVGVEQRRVSWTSCAPAAQEPEATQGTCQNWNVLTSEMKRYEYEISPSGGITYNAPSGYHDDCVMALALANHGRWEAESSGRMIALGGIGRPAASVLRRRQRILTG